MEALLGQGVLRKYDSGATISDPESRPEKTFLCVGGTLKVTKLLASGREILITILQTDSLWSDRAILNGYWREIFIEALEPSEVYAFDNVVFEAFLRTKPELLTGFMQKISEQVSDALTLLDDFRGRDVASRLARVLVKFSQQYGVKTDSGVRIDLPVTHQDLANMIGTAREPVSRNMARFRQKGYVRDASTGQALELLDLGSLEALIV
ncbi:MAG: Crp/Fnr family transcriptional regulator [Candidatus Eremiobacteraeota bacterium]|nr:Crp/Fnr family transcriptional regulator [Candidatus Eremiobacteraeota bacterium]